MKTNKKNRGFFGSLVKSFTLFALSILGLYFAMFIVTIAVVFINFSSADNIKLVGYEEQLIAGQYEEIESDLNTNSSLTVYNENFEVVYETDKNAVMLSEYELSILPNADDFVSVELTTHEGEKDKIHTITYHDEVDLKIILDSNYNVLYSDIELGKTNLIEQEFYLLSGALDSDTAISKLAYNVGEQTLYATITHDKATALLPYANTENIMVLAGYIFLFVFIIAVLIFIIRLDKKVKQPIELLSKSIKDFSKDSEYTPIKYKGPREFTEICDSFNALALKLETTEKERENAEEQKKKMLSDISHDLKTPITVIMGYAEALADDVVPEDKKAESLRMVVDKSLYLSNLVSELSEYNKLERPDFTLKTAKTNISEFTREYLINTISELENAGLALDADIPDEPIYCSIDAFQMRRVFDNIIGNSMKYHNTGNTLYFAVESTDEHITIAICDNGIGIAQDLRENLFTPFTMADKARTEGQGTGLGMAIAKKIIDAHGGSIALRNPTEQYNTIFEIKLLI